MKKELRNFYIKKGQTMTREEMMTYIFGNSIVDKLNDREKELMSKDEQKIFNTAYEEGWDDGYYEGWDDAYHDGYTEGIVKTMSWFEDILVKNFHFDSSFVRHVLMEWAAADLLTER